MTRDDPTTHRGFRIPDRIYRSAQAKALDSGVTLTDVVVQSLEQYASGSGQVVER